MVETTVGRILQIGYSNYSVPILLCHFKAILGFWKRDALIKSIISFTFLSTLLQYLKIKCCRT